MYVEERHPGNRQTHPEGAPSPREDRAVVTAIRVLIIDSDPLPARALRAALADARDIEVVGTASDADSGARLAVELGPDVVLVDGRIAGADEGGFLRRLSAGGRVPAVLVLARAYDDEAGIRTLRRGASGYLAKQLSMDALPRIVRALAAGEVVLSRELATRMVGKLREVPESGIGLRPVRSPLSTREWEVLDLLRAGASTRRVAEDLDLTVETVRSHVKRILRKLGAHTRAEAIEIAKGMMAPPSPPGAMAG
jgi:DNA-binding NarL/FixJ family response regulator